MCIRVIIHTHPHHPTPSHPPTLHAHTLLRHDYVQSYVKFVLVESVKAPFEAFRAGFRKVCDGSEVLCLFHYKELMAVVRGKQVVNFGKLEEVCVCVCVCVCMCVMLHLLEHVTLCQIMLPLL